MFSYKLVHVYIMTHNIIKLDVTIWSGVLCVKLLEAVALMAISLCCCLFLLKLNQQRLQIAAPVESLLTSDGN